MTRLLPAILALLLALPVAAKDKPFERPVLVRVDVDSRGSVVAADAMDDLPETLASMAEQATRGVLFEPAQVNGRAAASRTHLLVRMRFEPQDDESVSAKVLEVEAAKPVLHPPVYPTRAAQRGYGAHLVMSMQVNADGSVDMEHSGLHAISLWKGGRKLDESQVYRDQYVAETMKVMRHWRPMIEEVEGAPVATRWQVPVTFCPPGRPGLCEKIKAESPAPVGRSAREDGIRLASLKTPAAVVPGA